VHRLIKTNLHTKVRERCDIDAILINLAEGPAEGTIKTRYFLKLAEYSVDGRGVSTYQAPFLMFN